MNKYRIGIDLGGTKIEAILLSPEGEVVHRKRVPSAAREGYEPMLAAIERLVGETVRLVPHNQAYCIGIGIPGSINPQTGLVQNANSTCLIGNPMQLDLEQRLGRTIAVRNDADCFTLAECRMGAAQGYNIVFGIIMGTGCGGGLAINGNVEEGMHRIRGEWGHFSVDPLGLPCYCGNRGCVETKISGSGVEAGFLACHGRRLPMEEIVAGARRGKADCAAAFEQYLDDFGRCLGGLISILDPDAVVLGGGLSNIEELYTEGIERVRRYAFHQSIGTPILKNRLGDSAGVFGAAWIGI